MGTLGGAVYAGTLATLVPHYDEISLLAVLALAVAPLAAARGHGSAFPRRAVHGRHRGSGASGTHTDPIGSAFYRVLEVALGGATGLVVSCLVLPARAHVVVIDAAADMLGLLAQALPDLLSGLRLSMQRRSDGSRTASEPRSRVSTQSAPRPNASK